MYGFSQWSRLIECLRDPPFYMQKRSYFRSVCWMLQAEIFLHSAEFASSLQCPPVVRRDFSPSACNPFDNTLKHCRIVLRSLHPCCRKERLVKKVCMTKDTTSKLLVFIYTVLDSHTEPAEHDRDKTEQQQ